MVAGNALGLALLFLRLGGAQLLVRVLLDQGDAWVVIQSAIHAVVVSGQRTAVVPGLGVLGDALGHLVTAAALELSCQGVDLGVGQSVGLDLCPLGLLGLGQAAQVDPLLVLVLGVDPYGAVGLLEPMALSVEDPHLSILFLGPHHSVGALDGDRLAGDDSTGYPTLPQTGRLGFGQAVHVHPLVDGALGAVRVRHGGANGHPQAAVGPRDGLAGLAEVNQIERGLGAHFGVDASGDVDGDRVDAEVSEVAHPVGKGLGVLEPTQVDLVGLALELGIVVVGPGLGEPAIPADALALGAQLFHGVATSGVGAQEVVDHPALSPDRHVGQLAGHEPWVAAVEGVLAASDNELTAVDLDQIDGAHAECLPDLQDLVEHVSEGVGVVVRADGGGGEGRRHCRVPPRDQVWDWASAKAPADKQKYSLVSKYSQV